MKTPSSRRSWKTTLQDRLPRFGHRNWIVVADAAYPQQTSPGVETVCTRSEHLSVLGAVLREIDRAGHVRPLVHLDAELDALRSGDAPGIDALRAGLEPLLREQSARRLPHDQLIARLDEAGRRFQILLLKTTLLLPYTTVFIELECGYWSAAAEATLRK